MRSEHAEREDDAVTAERLGYRPELDGLRAVAAGLVFVFHAPVLRGGWDWLPAGGWVGVSVFFTLSGYLITSNLLRGEVSLSGFYAKRARRLVPALAVFLGVVGVVAWALDDVATLDAVPFVALYGGNLRTDMGWLAHTWTLAIEEHFYLAWPVVFLIAGRRLLASIVWLAAGSMLLRVGMVSAGVTLDAVRLNDLCQVGAMLVGCGLAVILDRGIRVGASAPVAVAGLVGCLVFMPLTSPAVTMAVGYSVVPVLTALLIAAWTDHAPRIPQPLSGFGRMSYGFYLWHYPLLIWIDRAFGLPLLLHTAAGFVATLWVARLSWVFIEEPILRRQSISISPVIAK